MKMRTPGWCIPSDRAAICGGCDVIFDLSDGRCPKCSTELAWARLDGTQASALIGQLKDIITALEGALRTLLYRNPPGSRSLILRAIELAEPYRKEAPVLPAPRKVNS